MENLKSLRSLDSSGGPPGTGRSTSPFPGTPERDFEADLTRARRVERRGDRRERAESAGDRRVEDRRLSRAQERREAAAAREAGSAEGSEVPAPELEAPQAVSPALEPPPAPEAGAPDEAQATQPEADRPSADTPAVAGTPARGAGAAVEALPIAGPNWAPVTVPAPLAAAPPTGTGGTEAEVDDGDAAPGDVAPAFGSQKSPKGDADGSIGNQERELEPRTDPAQRRDAADAPRAVERAAPPADAAPGAGDSRGLPAPRAVESARAVEPPAPPPAPTAAPEAAEHAAAILRQVRLRLSPGAREATLQLEPARLGRLSIRLELRRGATRAEVVTEEAAAFEVLALHEPELRAALADAGFPGVEIELRHAGDGAGPDPFAALRAPESAAPRRMQRTPLARALAARLNPNDGVDTYA